MTRPALARAQQGVAAAQQACIGDCVDGEHILDLAGGGVGNGRQRAKRGGIADKDIEFAKALIDLCAERIDHIGLAQIEWHNGGRLASDFLDFIVHGLEPTDGAPREDDMCPLGREALGHRRANAATGAGDEGNFFLEAFHGVSFGMGGRGFSAWQVTAA